MRHFFGMSDEIDKKWLYFLEKSINFSVIISSDSVDKLIYWGALPDKKKLLYMYNHLIIEY